MPLKVPSDLAERYPRQRTESVFAWHDRLWNIALHNALKQMPDGPAKDAFEALTHLTLRKS